MKKKAILILLMVLVITIIAYIKSCTYLPIEGTVIDAETKKPIEGAVVLAEWTLKSWIPDGPTRVYKVIESVSDKNGKFIIDTYILRPVSDSYLTIYKAGYAAWNNKFIFPDYKHREDFKWNSHRKYELDKFKKEYSYIDHVSFIDDNIHSFLLEEKKNSFINAYHWEMLIRQKELGGGK